MKIHIKKLNLGKKEIFFLLFLLMPFIDTLSGYFHDVYPIGQVYRILIFAYILYLTKCFSGIKFGYFIWLFCIFLAIQTMIGGLHVKENMQGTVKLFTPIFMIVYFKDSIRKGIIIEKDIYRLFKLLGFLYPILIIIPGVLGISSGAYDATIGWKGFFYATNEISFIACSLVMYSFYNLTLKTNIENIILLLLNITSIIVMGTKTGYATIIIFSFIYLLRPFFKKQKKYYIESIVLLLNAIIVIIIGNKIFSNIVFSIVNRWHIQRTMYSHSILDFLTSHRLRRIQNGFDSFLHDKPWYPFCGWGFGGELAGLANIEMDCFDLLFRTGIIGTCFILGFYYFYWKKYCSKCLESTLIIAWSFAISFGAGHVLFYGQSGMMLALLCSFAMCIKQEKIFKKLSTRKVPF